MAKPDTSFIAAALVLLGLPLLVMVGVSAFDVASRAAILSDLQRMMHGDFDSVWATLFVVWVMLVTVVTLLIVSHVIRRSRVVNRG